LSREPKRLSARWLADCTTDEERKSRYVQLVGGRNLFELTREVLLDQRDELESRRNALPKYEEASWPYRQAHLNGEIEQVDRLLELIPSDDILIGLSKRLK
jgi:hypothetical protein